jgi:uroporphyrinogen-III decarboxylase
MDCMETCPFVHQTLSDLRREVGNEATVLGFVGLPYTLATYLVEGSSSKEYLEIKKMMFQEPALLHQMLSVLADNIGRCLPFLPPSLPPSLLPPKEEANTPASKSTAGRK